MREEQRTAQSTQEEDRGDGRTNRLKGERCSYLCFSRTVHCPQCQHDNIDTALVHEEAVGQQRNSRGPEPHASVSRKRVTMLGCTLV